MKKMMLAAIAAVSCAEVRAGVNVSGYGSFDVSSAYVYEQAADTIRRASGAVLRSAAPKAHAASRRRPLRARLRRGRAEPLPRTMVIYSDVNR